MAIDKTKNKQVILWITNELHEEIEDYQFGNRIQSKSEAIRELIQKGLNEDKGED